MSLRRETGGRNCRKDEQSVHLQSCFGGALTHERDILEEHELSASEHHD